MARLTVVLLVRLVPVLAVMAPGVQGRELVVCAFIACARAGPGVIIVVIVVLMTGEVVQRKMQFFLFDVARVRVVSDVWLSVESSRGGGPLGSLPPCGGRHSGMETSQIFHHLVIVSQLVGVDSLRVLAEVVESRKAFATVAAERTFAGMFSASQVHVSGSLSSAAGRYGVVVRYLMCLARCSLRENTILQSPWPRHWKVLAAVGRIRLEGAPAGPNDDGEGSGLLYSSSTSMVRKAREKVWRRGKLGSGVPETESPGQARISTKRGLPKHLSGVPSPPDFI